MFLQLLFLLPLSSCLMISPLPPSSLFSPSSNVTSQLNISNSSPNSHCVSTGKYPEWNGRIRYSDCEVALSSLRHQTAKVSDELFAFYTDNGGYKPPPSPSPDLEWTLPTTMIYGTCVLQIRMFRDFENSEVPTEAGQYIVPSQFHPAQLDTWGSIVREATGVMRCVKLGTPGWGSEGLRPILQKPKEFGDIGIFFWGYTSKMAHLYAKDGQVTLVGDSGTNDTSTA